MKISQCSIDFYTIVPYGKHQKVVSNVCWIFVENNYSKIGVNGTFLDPKLRFLKFF